MTYDPCGAQSVYRVSPMEQKVTWVGYISLQLKPILSYLLQ